MKEREMDNLIAKYLSGNATPEELAKLEELKKNESFLNAYDTARAAWDRSAPSPVSSGFTPDWEDLMTRVSQKPEQKKLKISWLRMAAGIILITCLTTVLILVMPVPTQSYVQTRSKPATTIAQKVVKPSVAATPTIVETPVQPKKRHVKAPQPALVTVNTGDSAMLVTLPDDSHVYLNAHSSLTYNKKFGSQRIVSLVGEAFFDVNRDSTVFAVTCGKTITTVLGTSFNIRAYHPEENVDVMVMSGLVEVKSTSSTNASVARVTLHAGEAISFKTPTEAFTKISIKKKDRWWERGSMRKKLKEFFDRLFGRNKQTSK